MKIADFKNVKGQHCYIIKTDLMQLIKILFIISSFLLTTSPCRGQEQDLAFLRQFYKASSTAIRETEGDSKVDDLLYFEVEKVDSTMMITKLTGVDSRFVYDLLINTLHIMNADSISSEKHRYLYYRVCMDYRCIPTHQQKDVVDERVQRFRKEYGIEESVPIIMSSYGLPQRKG